MRRVMIIGAGLTGCQLLHLGIAARNASIEFMKIVDAVNKLTITPPSPEAFEITAVAMPEINFQMAYTPKQSRFTKQQHRYAMKYHSRK